METAVDVVIPSRNRVKMTVEAVESVQQQTFANWNVLVVDDASDDGADSALEQALGGDDRVSVLRRAERGGPQAARETGFRHSSAPLIAFLDSDDLWLPQKLEQQVAALEADGEVDVALAFHEWVSPDGVGRGVRKPYQDATIGPLISTNMSTPVIRRSALGRIGGMLPPGGATYRTCEGIEFYLRLSGSCRFTVVEQMMVRCREHDGPRSSDGFASRAAAAELADALERNRDILDRLPVQRAHLSAQAAVRYFAAGDRGAGLRWLRRSIVPGDPGGSWRAFRRFGPAVLKTAVRRRARP